VGLTTPHSKKLIVMKVEQRKSWMDLTMMERVGDRWKKNGRILFDRPKPTVGCSASGRRRRSSGFLCKALGENNGSTLLRNTIFKMQPTVIND
jgi:hypothetical protein